MLTELGFEARAFSSAEDLLAAEILEQAHCLILDVAMPGMTGPELQLQLIRRQQKVPIVFLTAYVDEAVRRSVIQRGAVDCLFKPFTEEALLRALNRALGVQP